MVNLLYCEFLKLKRSQMFLISIMGAFVAPLMVFGGWMKAKVKGHGDIVTYEYFFSDVNLYTIMVFGLIVYCVIAAYLFSREHTENTLKTILTIPVSKTKFIFTKFIMLYIWIIGLTLITWTSSLILTLIGGATDFRIDVIGSSSVAFLLGATLLYLTLTPFVYATLWFKNIVPVIIGAASVTMINIMLSNDELMALFPWTATYVIASHKSIPTYPVALSYLSVLIIGGIGFVASLLYFKGQDII
ncbi:ABC transporter permease [Tepidibacter hydrothermalis]|uniref:ABC transporter permease n=1 Tax=Tepidibacter hydrothermalis TaxID=3036126 RepID=A0ABY8EBF0_9FIRM|nr:ABC transporter permease [Tepidibacter hydrothermalis]WFD08914.1 ABC transporter permease [Tepidibacter hydrothermalis]